MKLRDFQEQASRSGSFRVRQAETAAEEKVTQLTAVILNQSHASRFDQKKENEEKTERRGRVTEGQPHIKRWCQCLTSLK